jgi:carboxymethylenebutenolidase
MPLPSAKPATVSSNVVVQPPLTRRGHGPGLILLVPTGLDLSGSEKTLDPPPLQKWSEEGFAVAQITLGESEGDEVKIHLQEATNALSTLKECDSADKIGLICRSY